MCSVDVATKYVDISALNAIPPKIYNFIEIFYKIVHSKYKLEHP